MQKLLVLMLFTVILSTFCQSNSIVKTNKGSISDSNILTVSESAIDSRRAHVISGNVISGNIVSENTVSESSIGFEKIVVENRYAYSTLSQEEQQLYDEMYNAIFEQKDVVRLTTKNEELIDNVYDAVCLDNGDMFWNDGYKYVSYCYEDNMDETIYVEFKPSYIMTKEERDSCQLKIDIALDEFLSGAKNDMTDYEKSKYVYETLINNVVYNVNAENNQNMISTFLNKETVCKGYACAAQYMFKHMGIHSEIIIGKKGENGHAWNLVKLDGEWYHFDSTWGDTDAITYIFLNVTDEMILSTRTIDEGISFPACTSLKNNYFTQETKYVKTYNTEYVDIILKNSYLKNEESCDIKFSDKESMEKAVNYLFTENNIYKDCEGLNFYTYFTDDTQCVLTIWYEQNTVSITIN